MRKNKVRTFICPDELYDRALTTAERWSERTGIKMTPSDVIRIALKKYFEAEEDSNEN